MLTRRRFVQGSLAALGTLPHPRRPRLARPSDAIRIGVVGLNGRGQDHVEAFRALPEVEVVALCDVDELVLAREAKKFRERGERVATHGDFRRLLERSDVDAVSIATPNHWHALQSIWACQAGKDVYLEKPVSHDVFEGRQAVLAARKYGRIVQSGTQSRSSPAIAEAFEWVRAGNLGALRLARGLCYKPRPSIGKVQGAQKVPDSIDYDMWTGPAALEPLKRARLHYDWHWIWSTGNGDIGNQGVHQLDLCRWALGQEVLPASVLSIGARLGYDDDGETPNTQLVWFGYSPVSLCFEVRGLPRDKEAQAGDWGAAMDAYLDTRIGVILHCEGGTLRVPSYSGAVACDAEGRELHRWEQAGDHFANFIAAVKSRRREELTADVEQGHLSSALCHLANASHRLGGALERDAIAERFQDFAALRESCERLCAHLDANGVDLQAKPLAAGALLELDPLVERCRGDERTNRLLAPGYREPFVVPGVV
jgi:predicted dehydrogenase